MGAVESSEANGEWISVVIEQLSPRFSEFASTILRDRVEPVVRKSLQVAKNDDEGSQESSGHVFHFERMDFGSVPPKISNIVAHRQAEEDAKKIVLDFDILYQGDCDLQVRILGIRSGVRDVQFSGRCRLVLGPTMSTMPLVGGIHFCFLDIPKIDFDMEGLANIADWPGRKVRKELQADTAKQCVYPNKVSIPVSKEADPEVVQCAMPRGYLFVRVLRAEGLPKKEGSIRSLIGQDKPDCYVKVSLGAIKNRTAVVKNCCDPIWEDEQWFCFPLETLKGHFLHFRLFDEDTFSRDEFLGRTSIYIEDVSATEGQEMESKLIGDTSEKSKYTDVSGSVFFSSYWLPLTSEETNMEELGLPASLEQQLFSLIHVFVYSANNITTEADLASLSDAQAPTTRLVIAHNGQEKISEWFKDDFHPRFEYGADFQVNPNELGQVALTIQDKSGSVLGQYDWDLSAEMKRSLVQISPDARPFATLTLSTIIRHFTKAA